MRTRPPAGRVWRRPGQTGLLAGTSARSRIAAQGPEVGSLGLLDGFPRQTNGVRCRSSAHGAPAVPIGGGRMKDVGLVGVPVSGKSTLFTAVTRAGSHAGQANSRRGSRSRSPGRRPHADGAIGEDRLCAGAVRRRPGVSRARRASPGCARPTRWRLVVRCFGPGASAGIRASRRCEPTCCWRTSQWSRPRSRRQRRRHGETRPDVGALRVAKDALDAETPLRSGGTITRGRGGPPGVRSAHPEAARS